MLFLSLLSIFAVQNVAMANPFQELNSIVNKMKQKDVQECLIASQSTCSVDCTKEHFNAAEIGFLVKHSNQIMKMDHKSSGIVEKCQSAIQDICVKCFADYVINVAYQTLIVIFLLGYYTLGFTLMFIQDLWKKIIGK